jgi:hypothetical protein
VLWGTAGPRSTVLGRDTRTLGPVAFTKDGRCLLSLWGALKRWPLKTADSSGVLGPWPPRPGAFQ